MLKVFFLRGYAVRSASLTSQAVPGAEETACEGRGRLGSAT
jgi:hypothetical protein